MLAGGYNGVLQAKTREEFRAQIVSFANRLGFETVSAMTVIDHVPGQSEFLVVDNTPGGYADAFADKAAWPLDPVMQHCKRNTVPIVWDQGTYVSRGVPELWEQQAPFGFQNGIAMALHMPDGRHFFFGVDRHQALPTDPETLQRVVADLQLFAVYAQDTAMRVLVPEADRPESPSLTPRELETLRWTMEGKTAWEVGAILGISERTAVLHLHNGMRKLGASNKHHAVLKALRLGLIH